MPPIRDVASRHASGRDWNDGFVNQKLLGLIVATLLCAAILGGRALAQVL